MALSAIGWWLSVTLVDNGADETTKTYQLTSVDAATAAIDSAAVLAALNAVTDAVVKSYQFYEKFVEDAMTLPAAGIENENMALLTFDLEDHPEKRATHTIPAANIGIFVAATGAGAKVVDTGDAALITYRDLFRTGGECLISDGEVADTLIGGRRISRKSG